ncbi:MAG: carbamoyltransferase HypF [Bacteroidales bacterium]|nr:carbamoyltransferase HypF [Bacteroidales bacterium]
MSEPTALLIRVEGRVQGVGYRPFVYRLAKQHNLSGWVVNRNDAVVIKIEGDAGTLPLFVEDLRNQAPVVAEVKEITVDNDIPEYLQDFRILSSQDLSDETSEISPDIAVCPDCLDDMRRQSHRLDYPFINCTNCGPRFSIIHDFPYDRDKTTMSGFTMCEVCRSEYENMLDRRFHAQPIACNACGPKYTLHYDDRLEENFPAIISTVARYIREGSIVAVKGVGGFHLMCDALNPEAVSRLRNAKKREGKPFAVMFRDLLSVKKFTHVSEHEAILLTSWRRPIVLLNSIKEMTRGVCIGLNTIGAFLPYMPFHYRLFKELHTDALVLTSGNFAEEPIVIENETALIAFRDITGAILTYNRDIFNRNDDSVTRFMGGKERIIRRSRGYVPSPIDVSLNVDGILATGAELSNCFCIGKGNQAILSQHIGDLKNAETYVFYTEIIERFKKLYRITPSLLATDMHPDYLSTRYAQNLGIEVVTVQHHHAHIAACMAEYGLDEPVIGVCFDGTGYGTDGNTWGSEFMVATLDEFRRCMHFDYIALPGGDKVTSETWRTGISLLYKVYGKHFSDLDIPFIRDLDKKVVVSVTEALEKKINTPLSSGCGRLFDGIAAIAGICTHALFHAEAPMRLESVLAERITDRYDVEINTAICFDETIRQVVKDIKENISLPVISARFHNSIIWSIFESVSQIRQETGITKVVLAGGSFQNKYVTEKTMRLLADKGLDVYLGSQIPCNDGGIALGQLMVAARYRENKSR